MDIPKTCDDMQIKFKIPNTSQEPSGSSEAKNQDLKGMDVLSTFKINIDSGNSEYG